MENLTRGGVAYNFDVSPYRYNVCYDDDVSITYVFSSNLYRNNFIKHMNVNRRKINKSLSNRFNFEICLDVLCDLRLYTSIEKRGFLIYQNGERFECLSNLILDGCSVTMKL